MRLTTIAVCSVLLGCATPPQKPVVSIGAIDIPAGHVLEGLSDGSDPIHPVPLADYDKATCFKPRAWELEKVYIKLMENFAQSCHSLGSK